jgi:murein DD-endopeptidase MepM/ murein hydrolase activator NlpD
LCYNVYHNQFAIISGEILIPMSNIEIRSESADVLSGVKVKPAKLPPHIFILESIMVFYRDLGKSVCEIISDLVNGLLILLGRLIGFVWVKSENFRSFMLGKFKYAGIVVFSPLFKFELAYSRMRKETRAANRENGLKGAAPVFFAHAFSFIFGKRGAAVTIFNYLLPVISIIFLVNVISYTTALNYAVRLEVNGQFVGYIKNELVYTEAEKIFEQRLNFLGSATMVDMQPSFSIETIGYTDLLSVNSVVNILLEKSGVSVEYAFGITINNNFVGAVTDNRLISETLDSLLEAHRTGTPGEEVDFFQPIDVEYGFFPTATIVEPLSIARNITRVLQEAQFYTAEEGDSQYSISNSLGVSEAELSRLNPGWSDMIIQPGQQIMFAADVPYLSVAVTRTEIYDADVAFITEYQDDNSIFIGNTLESRAGTPGVDKIAARVTVVNGVETRREVIERQTVSAPVSRVISRGTRPLPAGIISDEHASFGMFIWPTVRSVSRITEYGWWDGGYWGHAGVDIAAPHGTHIFAGASGTVVSVGWQGGYGNTVIIDHGNNLRTLYSHASAFADGLHVGQVVSQGETIAFIGQTGTAYGNHLHFEVIENGRRVNPIHFLET